MIATPASRPKEAPIRILHVVGGMSRGGIETWLMHVIRRIDRDAFQMDFLVHTDSGCAYDAELLRLGSRLCYCPTPKNPVQYAINFSRILAEHGPYDVVHSHVHHFSGYVMKLARAGGVPIRIAHSHNDTAALDRYAGPLRRTYTKLCEHWILSCSTHFLAASEPAGVSLFGHGWRADKRSVLTLYGLDLASYVRVPDARAVRAELGLTDADLVIGHVGRFHPQKNHEFLIEVAALAMRENPHVRLLLVGEGLLRATVEQMVHRLDISDRVVFAGGRDDVAQLMQAAMDVMLFPSRYEGLGIVVVEAQAAGLPVVTTSAVPAEAIWRPELVTVLSLDDQWAWVREVTRATRKPRGEKTAGGPFQIESSVENLAQIYRAGLVPE